MSSRPRERLLCKKAPLELLRILDPELPPDFALGRLTWSFPTSSTLMHAVALGKQVYLSRLLSPLSKMKKLV